MIFLDGELSHKRDLIKQKIEKLGVSLPSEIYRRPPNLMPFWQKLLGVKEGDFPIADLAKECFVFQFFHPLLKRKFLYVVDNATQGALLNKIHSSEGK